MRLICSPEYRKYAFTEKLYYLEELETTSLSNYKSTYNKKMSVSLFRLRFIKKYMVSCSIHGNFSLLNEVKSQKGGIHGLHNNWRLHCLRSMCRWMPGWSYQPGRYLQNRSWSMHRLRSMCRCLPGRSNWAWQLIFSFTGKGWVIDLFITLQLAFKQETSPLDVLMRFLYFLFPSIHFIHLASLATNLLLHCTLF